MKRTGPLVALLLATLTNASIPKEEARPAYRDPDTRMIFPQTLGGLLFYKKQTYEEPGMGYSLRYQGNGFIKADIYVYDKQIDAIPNGQTNKLVTDELESVKNALQQMQERGDFKDLAQTDQGVRPAMEAFQFRWATYEFVQMKEATSGEKMISEAFVTGFAGRFIKARLSYTKKDIETGRKTSKQLATDLSHLLKTAGLENKRAATQSILQTIEIFKKDPASEQGIETMGLIVNFAKESEDVMVTLDNQSCPWLNDREYKQGHVLLAAYVAGNMEAQLRDGQKVNHAYEGALQVIATYEHLRKRNLTEEISSIEEWIRQQKAGTLKSFLQKKATKIPPITKSP